MSGTNYLDGPKFIAWLERKIPEFDERLRDDDLTRRMYDWRRGGMVKVSVADRILLHFNRHLSEIPDSYYVTKPFAGGETRVGYPQELIDEALRLYMEGMPRREIADLLGIGPDTIQKWRRAAGLPALRAR